MSTSPITFIDLFCGIGSFHYSFRPLGWQCVMACDSNPVVRDTYMANYGMYPRADIVDIDPATVPSYDVLCAGFPCQPFSQCGQHKGFDDARGTLFFHIMKFVRHHSPKIILLENVQGLLTHDHGRSFARIQQELRDAGYATTHKVLMCSDYGIPQMRKRLFVVATRMDVPLISLDFDAHKRSIALSEYLGKPFEKQTAYTIRCGGRHSPIHDKHNWDGYIVDGKEYRLTITDGLRLQGFAPEFVLCGSQTDQWKHLGNTIPTILTELIGKNIHCALSVTLETTVTE
jgi:DNA (cytosine-5)-methyltransferase 1